MSTDDLRRIANELKKLRQGKGLKPAKLLRFRGSPLLRLPVVDAMVHDQDTATNRALAVCGVIHQILHDHAHDSREYRALAWALNFDVSSTWSGGVVALSDRLLMARRELFAAREVASYSNGKPVDLWENAAIESIAHQLIDYPVPPIALDGTPYVEPPATAAVQAPAQQAEPTPVLPTPAASSEPLPLPTPLPISHEPLPLPTPPPGASPVTRSARSPSSPNRIPTAIAVAVLIALVWFIGSRVGRMDEVGGDRLAITDVSTPIPTATDELDEPAPSAFPSPETAAAVASEPSDEEPAAASTSASPSMTASPTVAIEPTPEPAPTPTATPEPQPTPTPAPVLLDMERFVDQDGESLYNDTYVQDVNVAGVFFEDAILIEVYTTNHPPNYMISEFSTSGGPFTRLQARVGMSDGSDSQAVVRLEITDERLDPPLYSRDFRLGEWEDLDLDITGSVRLRFVVTVLSGRRYEYSGIGLGDPKLS